MPLRFFRRVRIAPGVSVNISKSGASVSVGPRGAKVTVGPRGVRKTVGLPGTGAFYTTTSPFHDQTAPVSPIVTPPSARGVGGFWARRSLKGKSAIVVLAVLLLGALNPNGPPAPNPANALVPAAAAASPSATRAFLAVGATPLATAALTPEATPRATAAATPKPTPKLTPRPTPKATPRPKPVSPYGNPWGYNFSPGSVIKSPPGDFCSYFPCIASFWDSTNGYVVQCGDGDFSHSGGRSGVCSHHGGYSRTLFRH
jgi:hypothetical protein